MLEVPARACAIRFPVVENPDWDHARTRRLALRSGGAEWCQSSLTQREADNMNYHRTDFAYEGLLCLVGGENWKMVDRIGFGVTVDLQPYSLCPTFVEASPDFVSYTYDSGHGSFQARYRILEISEPDGSLSSVWTGEFGFLDSGPPGEVFIDLKPLFDMRHMYYYSDPDGYELGTIESRLVTLFNDKWLAMSADADFTWVPERHSWDLVYRMGAGNREIVDGRICFRREYFRGMALGRIRFTGTSAHLFLAAGATEQEVRTKTQHASVLASKIAWESQGKFTAHLDRYQGLPVQLPSRTQDIATRAYVMAERFGIVVDGHLVPESGAWWFRTPWFTSVFSGLLNNWRTLHLLGKDRLLNGAVQAALRYQHPETGQLPNRIPELRNHQDQWADSGILPAEYYLGSGAILHCFAFVAEAYSVLDPALNRSLREAFLLALGTFKRAQTGTRHGPPVLAPNGLLTTLPTAGWLSGRRRLWVEGLNVGDLPLRIDRNWQVEDILRLRDGRYAWERYQYPTFYLPEINAMWIRTLDVGIDLALAAGNEALESELVGIRRAALESFRALFWNPGIGYLYNVVTLEGRADPMVTTCGLEAASFLGPAIFTPDDLGRMWQAVKTHLLVMRQHAGRPSAFGLLAKDSEKRIFLGDDEYHEAVCWPRETPNLIRLLQTIGQQDVVRELLMTNLDHMLDEGVVFYANEILSLPEGVNPSPNPATSHNPVPVKNPMQWGSLWCDPYLTTL